MVRGWVKYSKHAQRNVLAYFDQAHDNASTTTQHVLAMTNEKTSLNGRAKGGLAVAAKMTPEERKARSAKGSAARWGLKALRKGNFKDEFGIDAECYVLDDHQKTAVVTQLGMGVLLGLGAAGSRLPRFVFNKTMSEYLGPELTEKLKNPVVFQIVSVGQSNTATTKAHGYDAAVLIDVCRAILRAKADGKSINPTVVAQAGIIVGASAKAGIQGLVYALAGYRPEIEEVIDAFRAFVQEEAKRYEREFPPELYMAWARLYDITAPVRGRSWKHRHLTVDHVYYPLAKSDGKLLTLLKESRASDGGGKKLFQFLNEVGTRALRIHLGRLLEMAESSHDKIAYETKFAERFGGQQALRLDSTPDDE